MLNWSIAAALFPGQLLGQEYLSAGWRPELPETVSFLKSRPNCGEVRQRIVELRGRAAAASNGSTRDASDAYRRFQNQLFRVEVDRQRATEALARGDLERTFNLCAVAVGTVILGLSIAFPITTATGMVIVGSSMLATTGLAVTQLYSSGDGGRFLISYAQNQTLMLGDLTAEQSGRVFAGYVFKALNLISILKGAFEVGQDAARISSIEYTQRQLDRELTSLTSMLRSADAKWSSFYAESLTQTANALEKVLVESPSRICSPTGSGPAAPAAIGVN